jgi:dihydrodipicolinate synthase/N-acetylneuraminate lyase
VGGVLAVACLAPTACVELYQACQRGDQSRIRVLQDRLATLSRKTTVNGIGHLKAALDLVGLYGYLPRSPLPAPSDEERREIDAALGESGFFDRAIDGLTWIERHELHDLEFAD